ncbi:MAG: hypothetical protein VYB44_16375 [Bacteroidota bacterium]|nr:hypothetical protein [Bacteroidota bacterium]
MFTPFLASTYSVDQKPKFKVIGNKVKITIIIILSILSFTILVGNAFSGDLSRVCTVSSNPINNYGHCRPAADGVGDECYIEGEGPACDGEKIIPK